MFEFKTGCEVFYDHLGRAVRKPEGAPVVWRPSAYALINVSGWLLMVKPRCTPDTWGLPGGGIETHESTPDALHRECREELGFDIQLQADAPIFFGEYAFYDQWANEFMHSLIYVFDAQALEDISRKPLPVPPDPAEILKIEWVDPARLDESNCHHTLWPLIQRYKH